MPLRPGLLELIQHGERERLAPNPAVQFMVERVRATAAACAEQVPGVRVL